VAYAALRADGSAPDLAVLNLETNETRVLQQLPAIGNLALGGAGGRTAVVTSEQGVQLIDVDGGEARVISAVSVSSQWPQASEDIICWYDALSSYAYLVEQDEVITLASRPNANGVECAGKSLLWLATRDPAQTLFGLNWDVIAATVP
jgi:hypothetical protein